MQRDQLDGLLAFVYVAEKRSFTAAAARLGVSPSAVSQTVRQLEQKLGLRLLNRTTRSVGLTEAGTRFLERVGPAVGHLLAAVDDLSDLRDRPSGLLRLNLSRIACAMLLEPVLSDFLRAYPEIRLDVALDDGFVDIVKDGFDAGIRLGGTVERDMVAIRLGPEHIGLALVGSPDYLARRGRPEHPRDLAAHDCVRHRFVTSGVIWRWEFEHFDGETVQVAVDGPLIANDSSLTVRAALDGIGLAYTLDAYVAPHVASGRLVRLLPDWSPRFPGFQLYHPGRIGMPPKLRAFVDFIRERAAAFASG